MVFLVVREVGILTLRWATDRFDGSLHEELARWDGSWFIGIADHGYDNLPRTFVDGHGHHTATTAFAFFPGYPTFIAVVGRLPGVTFTGAAIAVSVVAAVLASIAVHRLAVDITGSPRAALLFVAVWAGAPMAITYSMAYSEALFAAFATWALVAVVERRWLLAGWLTIGAGVVRSSSAALVVAVAVVAIAVAVKHRDRRPLVAAALAPVGLGLWLAYVARQVGRLDGWFRVQQNGWDSKLDFGVASWDFGWRSLTDHNGAMDTITTIAMIVAVLLVVLHVVWRRLPFVVWSFCTLTVALVVLEAGTMSSKVRLLLPATLLLLPLTSVLATRAPAWLRYGLVAAWIAFGSWFSAYSLTGWHYAI